MKKLICLALLLSASFLYVKAQTVAGTKMLGGGLTYSSEKGTYLNEDEKYSSLFFNPSMGYFISDGLAIGINLAIGSSKEEVLNNEDKTSTFGIGPFARYYMHTSNENFAFFAQGSFLYLSVKDDPAGNNNDSNGRAIDFAISPGFAYFFNEHWSMELSFRGIAVTSSDPNRDVDDDESTTVTFGLNSLNPSIGVRYYFE